MRRAVQRFLPTRSQVQGSTSSIRKSLKFDSINLIQDFYIDLDEPHKVFRPGESIKGTIVLDLKKNITDINITMTLIGFIKIKQTSNTTTVRSKPNLLFKHTTVIYGEDSTNKENEDHDENGGLELEEEEEEETHLSLSGLSKGEHRFPFAIKLPRKNIYTSITFEKGSISYSLRASINHNKVSPLSSLSSSPASLQSQSPGTILPSPKNSIQHCDKNLQIIVPINVAKIPKPSTKVAILKPSDKKLKKTVSSTSTVNSNVTQFTVASDNSMDSMNNQSQSQIQNGSPEVKLFVDITESGFLRGETVPVKIRLQHYKPIQSSSGIIVTLIRICRVDNGSEAPIQSFRKDLAQTIAPLYIDPETLRAEISTSLKVPIDVFPTIIGSDLVTFQYYIEVLANISSKNLITNNGTSQSSKTSKNKFSHTLVFNTETPQEREMSRSEQGVLNVDKLKRIKNFLGLNTEIIVGTERNYKRASIGKKTVVGNAINGNGAPNISRSSSYNGDSPVHFDSDNSIIEGFSQTSISPLSINGTTNGCATVTNDGGIVNNNNSIISTGEEIFVPPEDPNLSEKERMRLREQALLPSEPFISEEFSPAPSYSQAAGTSSSIAMGTNEESEEFPVQSSTSLSSALTTTIDGQYHKSNGSTDKAELERQRLQGLESDPPEFDYVPEYNPAGQDSTIDQNGGGSEIETLREGST